MTLCALKYNYANNGGGFSINNPSKSSVSISDSSIVGNIAMYGGGACYFNSTTELYLDNVTSNVVVAENYAGYGYNQSEPAFQLFFADENQVILTNMSILYTSPGSKFDIILSLKDVLNQTFKALEPIQSTNDKIVISASRNTKSDNETRLNSDQPGNSIDLDVVMGIASNIW